ncbi:MAG: hypothetical protein EA359_06130 [Balneolaceae bacterium]|nr:MAG: hypothetical protein EA359_06130 [Balneolaceae bacterium]
MQSVVRGVQDTGYWFGLFSVYPASTEAGVCLHRCTCQTITMAVFYKLNQGQNTKPVSCIM